EMNEFAVLGKRALGRNPLLLREDCENRMTGLLGATDHLAALPIPGMEQKLIIESVLSLSFPGLGHKSLPCLVGRIRHQQEVPERILLGKQLITFFTGRTHQRHAALTIAVRGPMRAVEDILSPPLLAGIDDLRYIPIFDAEVDVGGHPARPRQS